MTGSSAFGMIAAITAAATINIGTTLQKFAVSRAQKGALMPTLARDRLWLTGFSLQFLIGAPLTIFAVALIGPAMTPGLMASGLVVLALASHKVNRERFGRREITGITLTATAVILVASSALTVNLANAPFPQGQVAMDFFALCVVEIAAAAVFAGAGFAAERKRHKAAATLLALATGSAVGLSNLLLGPLSGGLRHIMVGNANSAEVVETALFAAIVLVVNGAIVVVTQRALRAGKAAAVVPIQQAPIQFAPIAAFFFVYRPFDPGLRRTITAILGATLTLAGAAILASAQRAEQHGQARKHGSEAESLPE